MYIYPDTIIKILKNVPLDPTYDHTIYWDVEHPEQGKQAQATYFSSKAKYTFDNQTYQRLQRGWMYIGRKADDLYDCNYIMFQNHAYGNKWFYAFLKGVEYENDHTSRVEFQIDVMQTWMFDYQLDQCFVEREHSATDGLFENIVTEDINIGNEYISNQVVHFDMNDMNLCILANRKLAGIEQTPPSKIINRIMMPLRIYDDIAVKEENISLIDTTLNYFNENDIICIYQYPSVFYTHEFPEMTVDSIIITGADWCRANVIGVAIEENELVGYQIYFGTDTDHIFTVTGNTATVSTINTIDIQFTPSVPFEAGGIPSGTIIHKVQDSYPIKVKYKSIQMNTTINGYTPKNKKLYSYPFSKLIVSNNSGQTAEYKWEYLSVLQEQGVLKSIFAFRGAIVSTPSVLCYPTEYRGVPNDYDSGIAYSNFPQCCWSGDVFKAWWAQNKASFVTSTLTSVLSSATGGVMAGVKANHFTGNQNVQFGATMGAVSAGLGIASTIANSVAKIEDIKNTPSQTHGQAQTDSLNPALGRVRFTFYVSTINAQYARIVDDYFERYGYATKRNKIPNRNVRPHWTFTKTIGCTLTGSIPADDATAICEIYNNGITFWANGSEVGNYALDNSPSVVQ